MKHALWAVNGLLAAGILAFAARYLVFPSRTDHLAGIDFTAALPSPPPKPGERPNEEVLRTLPNPLGPRKEHPLPPAAMITLHGAFPTLKGDQGVAFVRTTGNVSLVVPIGEEVQGWRLLELWKDRATFTNREGKRTELILDR